MNANIRIFKIILLGFLAACAPKGNDQSFSPSESLFDLKNYFESKAAELKQSDAKVLKTIALYGQSESKEVKVDDWNAELKPFLESDISKPALRNSYKVDSPEVRCPECRVIYTAIDSAQTIRSVDIRRSNGEISQIIIVKNSGGKLTKSSQTLTWMTGLGYSITGKQDVALGKENDYSIRVAFIH